MRRYAVPATLISALVFFGAAFPVDAANTGLTIQPIKASHTIEPGKSVESSILLTNASDEDINVDVKVEDFIPLAGADSIQFVSRAPGVTTVRDWVAVQGGSSFVFKKGETRRIPYTITAPADAEPGSHFGVAFFKATRLDDAGAQLKVGTQVGMLIFVTVPGDFRQEGRILDFTAPGFVQTGPVGFSMSFENTGTVHFEPKGKITIRNMFGNEVGVVPIEGNVVLPTGKRELKFQWDTSGILLGAYTADASVLDGEGNELTSDSVTFYAFPVWYSLGFIVSVLVLFWLFLFIKRRVRVSISLGNQ